MNQKEITNAIWSNIVVAMAMLASIVVTFCVCLHEQDFSSLIMSGPAYAIPCIAESLHFSLTDSDIEYGVVKKIIIGIIIVQSILLLFNIASMILGAHKIFVGLTMISMIIYAGKNIMLAVFYYIYSKKK